MKRYTILITSLFILFFSCTNNPSLSQDEVPFSTIAPVCVAGDQDIDGDNVPESSIKCALGGSRMEKTEYASNGSTKSKESTYYSDGKQWRLLKLTLYREDGMKKESETYFYQDETGKQFSDVTLYGENGNAEMKTRYREEGDGMGKISERTYYENGKTETFTLYHYGTTKWVSDSFYEETGNHKSQTLYSSDGSASGGYPKCYDTDGSTKENCDLTKHGVE